MQGVPRLLGHKKSDLRSNPWSETSWENSMTGSRNEETQDRDNLKYYKYCGRWMICENVTKDVQIFQH